MTVQYIASGSNMKAVKASVWSVFYRAFMVPPSNRTQIGVVEWPVVKDRVLYQALTWPLDWN